MKTILKKIYNVLIDTCQVWMNEVKTTFKDEGMLLFVILLPLAYPILYSWIYNNEVVREVPVAIVDQSHSATSLEFIRKCDASPDVRVAYHCNSLDEAKQLIGRQVVYGAIYIPEDFSKNLGRMESTTVGVYCNMGIMLTYKAIYQTATAVASEMNAKIQTSLSGHYTSREEAISTRPLDFEEVPMFNNTAGYGNFILPGVLILIIQQVLLLGIGLSGGTSYEMGRYAGLKHIYDKQCGTIRITAGRTLCYFMIFSVMTAYILLAIPRIFHFVHMLHMYDFICFALPYLLACIFFAMTFTIFLHQREHVMLLVVFTSVPFLFMSGVSWPGSNIPAVWHYISFLFPSTFGIQGFVKMNTTGALLSDIRPEIQALWIQVIVYAILAGIVQRYQIRKSLHKNDAL